MPEQDETLKNDLKKLPRDTWTFILNLQLDWELAHHNHTRFNHNTCTIYEKRIYWHTHLKKNLVIIVTAKPAPKGHMY